MLYYVNQNESTSVYDISTCISKSYINIGHHGGQLYIWYQNEKKKIQTFKMLSVLSSEYK